MKIRKSIISAVAATPFAVAALLLLSSCEGRKMTNMQPTGDTVEVVIETPASADSAAEAPDGTAEDTTN